MEIPKQADRAQLVQFSRVFAGFALIVLLLSFYRHGSPTPLALGFAVVGLLIGLTGVIRPMSLNWSYHKWMLLGEKLAVVVSKVVVLLTFFFVVTPVGIVLKLLGKDILKLKIDKRGETSYFSKPDQASSERHEAPF